MAQVSRSIKNAVIADRNTKQTTSRARTASTGSTRPQRRENRGDRLRIGGRLTGGWGLGRGSAGGAALLTGSGDGMDLPGRS